MLIHSYLAMRLSISSRTAHTAKEEEHVLIRHTGMTEYSRNKINAHMNRVIFRVRIAVVLKLKHGV